MGKPNKAQYTPPPSSSSLSYRDDPDAVSLHTTPGDIEYSDTNIDGDVLDNIEGNDNGTSTSSTLFPPPTYDEVTQYVDPDDDIYEYNGLNIRETHFNGISSSKTIFQKKRKTRIAGEHVRLRNPQADRDATYLQRWVEYMSRQAPTPYIVVTGTHSERRTENDGKEKREEVTDFRICVNIRNYLWPNFRLNDPAGMELRTVDGGEKTWRGTIFKTRAPGVTGNIEVGHAAKPSLQEWCHRYCASSSGTRIFRLTRTVIGLDEVYLRQRLTGLIHSTNYKGHLDISFPLADRAVDIYSSSRLNIWRLTTWICWLFYLTFLWILAWPILYFTTKRYNVVRAEWAFSRADANGNKKYTTVSEEQWVEKYGPAVRQLALDRYQGVAGDDTLNQVLARPETHRPVPAEYRHVRTAAAAVGAAVGAFNGRSNAVNQVGNLLRFVGGSNDEVGWGFDT